MNWGKPKVSGVVPWNPITSSNPRIIPSLPLSTTLCELAREKSKSRIDIPGRISNSEARNEVFIEPLIDHGSDVPRTEKNGDRRLEENEKRWAKPKKPRERADSPWHRRALLPYFRRACFIAIECTRESSHVVPYRPDTRGVLVAKRARCIGWDAIVWQGIFRELHETKT